MATAQRYPLSTPEGTSIPLEVVKPLGILRIPFTSSTYTSVTLNAAYQDKIFVVFSKTEDCYISFAAVPVAVVDSVVSADILHVPAGTLLAFISNTLFLSAQGVSAAGTVHVQIVDTWAGLALEVQQTRR